MKRYVRFDAGDEATLRGLAPVAAPHFRVIAEEFYQRLAEHDEAVVVFSGPTQVDRLKGTMCGWLQLLFEGPWDEEYFHKRARIGRIHVEIGLPQRFMFGAMNLIRIALQDIAGDAIGDPLERKRARRAIARIIDLELAIMLESYREAHVDKVQAAERREKDSLAGRLAISEARYQDIVEKATLLVTTFDEHGTVLLFNRRAEELTGLDRSEAIGRNWCELFFTPDSRPKCERVMQQIRTQPVVPLEGSFLAFDGSERRVRWHLTTLPGGGERLLCGLGVDITDEHALELRTRRSERLAALGTMAAGLAHEIRNPLNAAHLQLTVLQRRLSRSDRPDVDGARRASELVVSELRRLAGLVEEFLQFARPQPLRLERVDLRNTAAEVIALLAPEAAELGVGLTLGDGPGVTIEADVERLKQVLQNLVRNGVEATGSGGHVEVRVALAGGEVLLEIDDDGPGLPSPDAPIFEPFYTTKAEGTGLGLAIVHRIVTDHGGKVAASRRGRRTVFSISLPA